MEKKLSKVFNVQRPAQYFVESGCGGNYVDICSIVFNGEMLAL